MKSNTKNKLGPSEHNATFIAALFCCILNIQIIKCINRIKIDLIQSILLLLTMLTAVSCKKLIEVNAPLTSTNAGNVYTNDATAAAVLTDIYAEMSEQNNSDHNYLRTQNITSISLYTALAADELSLYNQNNPDLLSYFRNDLNKEEGINYWSPIYQQIFFLNSAIEGLTNSNSLTPSVKHQLTGEAKFMRAFCYFYLTIMYGDVPLVISTDYSINASLARTPKADVYLQIIIDLVEAKNLLSSKFLKGDASTAYELGLEERVRPNKWAATALLARVYLYIEDYVNAEIQATEIINNTTLFSLTALNEVFLKNSKEAIWQLQPVKNGIGSNTGEGRLFILPTNGPNMNNNPVYLSENIIGAFEAGDLRKSNWVSSVSTSDNTYYYPYKYKIGNVNTTTQEYPMILRLAEQYLIRSEARANQNNISGAQSDLNFIRTRAGLPNTIAADKPSLLTKILQERRLELFTEWGHRWFDLKRFNVIDATMSVVSPLKGGNWSPYKSIFPIPQSDIDKNPNIIQNQGY